MEEGQKQELINKIEKAFVFEIAEIKSHLAGGGSLWGRMNATDGGQEMSPFVKAVLDYCYSKAIKAEQVNSELIFNYLVDKDKNAK